MSPELQPIGECPSNRTQCHRSIGLWFLLIAAALGLISTLFSFWAFSYYDYYSLDSPFLRTVSEAIYFATILCAISSRILLVCFPIYHSVPSRLFIAMSGWILVLLLFHRLYILVYDYSFDSFIAGDIYQIVFEVSYIFSAIMFWLYLLLVFRKMRRYVCVVLTCIFGLYSLVSKFALPFFVNTFFDFNSNAYFIATNINQSVITIVVVVLVLAIFLLTSRKEESGENLTGYSTLIPDRNEAHRYIDSKSKLALDLRLVNGEISTDEYERILGVLKE